jgi:hypothetical protein
MGKAKQLFQGYMAEGTKLVPNSLSLQPTEIIDVDLCV